MSGFRLAALLRVRRLQEEAAAARAAAAAGAARTAAGARDARYEALGRASTPARADERAFCAAVAARTALLDLYTDSVALAASASASRDAVHADWVAARLRVRPLERLADRHAVEQQAEALRAEQALLDEHAGRMSGPASGATLGTMLGTTVDAAPPGEQR